MPERKPAAVPRWRAAEARVMELEAALFAIMRVTDPGDLRVREGRTAWEQITPARKIAREALGLPLGGRVKVDGKWVDAAEDETPAVGEVLDAERRGYVVQPEDQTCPQCFHHSIAHTAEGCGLDECQCKRSWSDLRG